jgi:hypothetical protein
MKRLAPVLVLVLAGCAAPSAAPMARTAPEALSEGHRTIEIHRHAEPLPVVVAYAAIEARKDALVASDVHGRASLDVSVDGTEEDAELVLDRFLREQGLSSVHVGDLVVASRAPLAPCVPEGDARWLAFFRAWRAPAGAWFDLLERATGRRVEHGDGTIDLSVVGVRADDVLRATAILSRAPHPRKQLEDLPPVLVLPSGRSVTWRLQATLTRWNGSLAIVDGRVLAAGDEIAPGVRVAAIGDHWLELQEGGSVCRLERS